jgi:hypothetical protein
MVPRTKVVVIEESEQSFAEVVGQFRDSGYSRLPVYGDKCRQHRRGGPQQGYDAVDAAAQRSSICAV